jgi:DNA primase
MRIPDSIIDDVRNASDIVDVIGSVVRLKKRGKNFLGLCPFHQEKTPSFTVSAEKQMFHCFGCSVGGNVFSFVMEHEKLTFVEAVRALAEKAGIRIPEQGGDDRGESSEQEKILGVLRLAGLRFHDHLMTGTEGKLALEYFRHRGLTDATIGAFGLGYALNSWDDILNFSRREGFDVGLLEKAGLVVRRDDGSGHYDRFRGRAMFPVFSPSGRVIAFGARKVREDDPLAKYINSPETPVYNKSRVLYGLSQAKDAIRDKDMGLLVEGYMDLITLHQAGFQNVVASSGTALTVEQIQLLGRYTKTITLVYDADSAGSKATLRGGDLVLEQDIDVRVTELPAGEDPDSFIRKNGGKAFQALLEGAVSFLDFRASQLKAEGLLSTPEGKARAMRTLVETVAKMKDELKRTFFIKRLAQEYDIYESVLFRELENILGKRQPGQQRSERPGTPSGPVGPTSGTTRPPVVQAGIPPVERDLLKLMLEHGSVMVRHVFERMDLGMITSPTARAIIDVILRHEEGGGFWDAGMIVDQVQDPVLRRIVTELTISRHEISKGWQAMGSDPPAPDPRAMADDCILRLHVQALDERIAETYRLMKDAQLRGEEITAFQQAILDLQRQKKDLQRH